VLVSYGRVQATHNANGCESTDQRGNLVVLCVLVDLSPERVVGPSKIVFEALEGTTASAEIQQRLSLVASSGVQAPVIGFGNEHAEERVWECLDKVPAFDDARERTGKLCSPNAIEKLQCGVYSGAREGTPCPLNMALSWLASLLELPENEQLLAETWRDVEDEAGSQGAVNRDNVEPRSTTHRVQTTSPVSVRPREREAAGARPAHARRAHQKAEPDVDPDDRQHRHDCAPWCGKGARPTRTDESASGVSVAIGHGYAYTACDMSDRSAIEWTDATWNPVRGCTKVSPGCANCYAETFAERFRGVVGHPYERGFDLRLVPEKLQAPLRWRGSRMIFVNSMSDLFHKDIPDDYIVAVAQVMKRARWHTFQVLTKRSERMRDLLTTRLAFVAGDRHVWWGVSVENRKHGLPRVAHLRDTPAEVRFLSIEPLLERLGVIDLRGIGWVIAGGESGPRARPMNPAWIREIRDQCVGAGVPFFFKQWGGVRKKWTGRVLDGRTWDELPTPGNTQVAAPA
jgi:protein gp37